MKPTPFLQLLALTLAAAACSKSPPPLPGSRLREAPITEIESVVFLIGDAGKARHTFSPVLAKVQSEVEDFARRIARDSAIAVVYLGDNVYPRGVHAPGSEEFPADSAELHEQVEVLSGPNAVSYQAQGYFVPGNHDWGQIEGKEGEQRLKNQEALLDRMRSRGPSVRMVPNAGEGGPTVLDVGSHLRMLLLDTAWWLLEPDSTNKLGVLRRLESALRARGEREILFGAHHPFKSASEHGGLTSVWSSLGVKYLLGRSGALLQDLNSIPYRELQRGLRAMFARVGPPLLFAAGHDHVLQVIGPIEDTDPKFSLVSGSASKTSKVGHKPGMLFRGSEPGYMRLMIHKSGQMDLYAYSAPESPVNCNQEDEESRHNCKWAGVMFFREVFGIRVK